MLHFFRRRHRGSFDLTRLPLKQQGLRPRADMLCVIPFVKAGASFILDAGDNREYPEKGIVIAVGPGGRGPETGRRIRVLSQPGDVVAFGRYAGIAWEIPLESGMLRALLLRDAEVMLSGDVPLVMHGEDPRRIHEAGLTCEWCPRADLSAERERLRAEREAQDDPGILSVAERLAIDGGLPVAGEPVAEEHNGRITLVK